MGAVWEPASGFGDGVPNDVAWGRTGWVAVGTSCGDGCTTTSAAAWFSTDGLTWLGEPIPDSDRTYLSTVTSFGSQWLAAGVRFEDDGTTTAVIWRSADSHTWSLADTIALGPCPAGCPWIEHLVAGPGGVILSWVHAVDTERSTVWWSADGEDWAPVDRAIFDAAPNARLYTTAAVVVGGRFVLVGGCRGCETVWSSTDGRAWSLDATLSATPDPFPADLDIDLATDGRRVLIVEDACQQACGTGIWSSADGRTGWTFGSDLLLISQPRVTFAANTFFLAGETAPNGLRVFGSPDGITWTVASRRPPLGPCGFSGFVGAGDRLLLIGGDEGCGSGIWVSRAPGT